MKYVYFKPASLDEFIKACNLTFKMDEPGLFIFFPKTDMDMRVRQILQDYSSHFPFPIIKTQLEMPQFESKQEIIKYFDDKITDKNKPLGIFVLHIETVIRDGNFHIIEWLIEIGRENPNMKFIFLSEADITNPEIAVKFKDLSLFANIRRYQIYNEKEAELFTEYFFNKWEQKFDKKLIRQICAKIGGHTWLLKEAVRTVKLRNVKTLDSVLSADSIQFKVEQIYSSLLDSEKSVLHKILIKNKEELSQTEKHSKNHLTKIGLLKENTFAMQILEDYISKTLPKVSVNIEGSHIKINGVIVNSGFSRKQQKILRYLLQHKNSPVTRDDLAKIIWPIDTLEYYTDWALDRIIARLRENIQRMGLTKNLIKTVRGVGYQISVE